MFFSKTKRRASRGIELLTKGRESVNSFEDSSVRNSQSGTTDGGISSLNKNSKLASLNNISTVTSINSINNNNNLANNANNSTINSVSTSSNTNNTTNYMSSTDTISKNQRETLHSRFDFVKVLGKGTYGKVKLANDKRTGKQVNLLSRLNFFSLLF